LSGGQYKAVMKKDNRTDKDKIKRAYYDEMYEKDASDNPNPKYNLARALEKLNKMSPENKAELPVEILTNPALAIHLSASDLSAMRAKLKDPDRDKIRTAIENLATGRGAVPAKTQKAAQWLSADPLGMTF
jgi:hypothetical protein